ncbi:DUF5790 family protein [Haloplanus salilacus]|uniref:DUF5790 family protein n=1 Tax=Haloplanus salilacus TaxID=2949994 RepID=UPI0030D0FA0C
MSQTTLGDDELFGEAAAEVRADVEEHLGKARAELPDPDEIWAADADNVLGVLNGLRSALDAGEAEEHLRQAKKWYTMGDRADAFEDAADLAEAIEELEELIESIGGAHDDVSDLTNAVPELRGTLEDLDGGEAGDE